MDELIFRILSGEATPFEEERLRRWRDEAPENEARVQELSRIWSLSTPEGMDEPSEEDVDRLMRNILGEAGERSTPIQPAVQHRRGIRSVLLWGSSLAAGLAALSLGLKALREAPPTFPSISTPEVVVSAPSPQTLRLADGSFVRLAPGSRLEVRFEDGERMVYLQGRAFFAVAPDALKPFLVRAGSAQVRVLGTRFEVAAEGDEIRAVVVEGRVALSSTMGEVEVPAGSMGTVAPGTEPHTETVSDPWALMDWPGGLLVFHETPLNAVVREVESHFHRRIRIDDPEAATLRISASFQENESFDEVLETLCAVTGARCHVTPDSAVIASATGDGT
jgi:ferric-dicitrate binding protein FerR (iron transport regulator)